MPSFFQRALTEALLRTQTLVPLPADTSTEIQARVDRPVRAMARYLGNLRSRVYLNPAVPFPLTDLLYVLCHEGHPGHLAEFVLKDEFLIQRRGYLEERVLLPCSPRFVISGGLALLAHEMIFAPGETEEWLAEHIYPEAGMRADHSDLTKIHRAKDLSYGVSCNAAWLLGEGLPEVEVLDYPMRYALLSEEAFHPPIQTKPQFGTIEADEQDTFPGENGACFPQSTRTALLPVLILVALTLDSAAPTT